MATKKDPLGIRLAEDERSALAIAAKMDGQTLSGMGRKAIVEWLRQKGYLSPVRAIIRQESMK